METIHLKWAQKSQITKSLRIRQGTGSHPYMTIKDGSMYFHTFSQIDNFTNTSEEAVNANDFEGYALEEETVILFRLDTITSVTNHGADDIYINFDKSTSEAGTITVKPGQTLTNIAVPKAQKMYFRSWTLTQPFEIHGTYTNLMYFQQVSLDGGMTLEDVDVTLRGMGYEVDMTDVTRLQKGKETALVLMDVASQPLTDWVQVYAFTSNFWRVLYPVHREITKFDGDIDKAIEQLLLPSTRGDWLDYWASFFRVRRLPEESDELLLRRVMLTLTSAKSNNVAMEELIGFYIGTEAEVIDSAPAQIEVRVDPTFMDSATKVREIIALLKGAGVDYFLNYQKVFAEQYNVYYRDTYGTTFGSMNESFSKITVTLPVYDEDYLFVPIEQRKTFVLNSSKLNSDMKLSRPTKKVVESLGMTMTLNGEVVQQM